MILPDVNVLVYAYREEAVRHADYREWLESTINADSAFGLSDLVLSGFLRVVTHPRILVPPSPPANAVHFVEFLRERPNRVAVNPGPDHWRVFRRLCDESGAKGNLVPDAYFAALAIERGCEWITTDRDFARFRGLRWRHPLQVS
ncbi:MAG: type II toxin-antitoxin system VapC family toxin [Acidobacteria bacterium]|nr:type II toxin-antitoxin system VapC family toxin [Acidobacteriota bacterium]MXW39079.1 type II toxin-antitoxin system VapC family toxin [Acidobacteriota bacterium]MYA47211.1 type II toxin-antitoxin system VapC family toxin [Acidobacteriota bacterium]MYI39368.1 type II toxin-antitoxin system VapC family toxin [Acidobacteriota bacterium]